MASTTGPVRFQIEVPLSINPSWEKPFFPVGMCFSSLLIQLWRTPMSSAQKLSLPLFQRGKGLAITRFTGGLKTSSSTSVQRIEAVGQNPLLPASSLPTHEHYSA
jgi:hypothetical protein